MLLCVMVTIAQGNGNVRGRIVNDSIIVGDDSLMNIDQYSIQRVAAASVKTDDVLNAHEPSTDAKKKKSLWKKLVG